MKGLVLDDWKYGDKLLPNGRALDTIYINPVMQTLRKNVQERSLTSSRVNREKGRMN